MKTKTFLALVTALMLISCEKDRYFQSGNYLCQDNDLVFKYHELINNHTVTWNSGVSEEQKEVVKELLSQMVAVKGGTFRMGNAYNATESPVHPVKLSDFSLQCVTVNQKQWRIIMGGNSLWSDEFGKGSEYPANFVSYDDVVLFISKLNSVSNIHFRLPTEAEWEYAAWGGSSNQTYEYSGSGNANEVAWTIENSQRMMHPSAQLKPNALGLYDMSGNVYEWCSDWYGTYGSSTVTDPTGPSTGSERVVRGGCFAMESGYARCKARMSVEPGKRLMSVGVRLAMSY
ncbi:MAG: formylglycine-generating enzyme family protein [Bacteroidales bacterium]|nr:formylglycine-generating enzyme family protein [Bacteroidales bacterium]